MRQQIEITGGVKINMVMLELHDGEYFNLRGQEEGEINLKKEGCRDRNSWDLEGEK